MKNYKDGSYDIEDDIIDRGDSSNMQEAFESAHLEIQEILPKFDKLGLDEKLNEKKESDYHNSYYKGKGKGYGSRTLRAGQMKKIIDEDGNYE